MTFLPIVERELRAAARRRGTYWLRAGAALWMILVGAWFFLVMQQQQPQELSVMLFGLLTGSSVLYCLLSGMRFTADCLSEEKREGTLGLLFLTDLKGYDVVLGKLTARSLAACYGVLAVVPMLAIPLLMGGLTVGEFGRMALVAVVALFFSLTVGLWASAVSRSARKAIALTLFILILFTALLPFGGAWLQQWGKLPRSDSWFCYGSIGFSYALAFDTPYKTGAGQFWWSLGCIQVLSWLFLGLASWIVPHSWQDRPASRQAMRWRERWRQWSYGELAERHAFRQLLVSENPVFWLTARARLRPALVWGVLGVLACVWAWGVAKFRREWLNEGMYFTTALVLNALIKGWFGAEVGRQVAEDRQCGALELLLSTPLTVPDLIQGQWLALKRQFLGPFLFIVACILVLARATMADADMESNRTFWSWLYGAGLLVLVADLAALFWLGQWLGLTVKNPARVANANLTRILLLPWVGMALALLVIALMSTFGRYETTPRTFILLWLVLSLLTDLGFGAWARHKLLTEYRLAAAQRFEVQTSFWRRLWRRASEKTPVEQVDGLKGLIG